MDNDGVIFIPLTWELVMRMRESGQITDPASRGGTTTESRECNMNMEATNNRVVSVSYIFPAVDTCHVA